MRKESRLKFTEEELSDPIMGKAAQKAEKAAKKADKAQQKIPVKKQVKAERTSDPETENVKVRLHFEDSQKKPPSKLTFAVKDAPGEVIRGHIHSQIRESEEDNIGVEAAATAERGSEQAGHALQTAYRSSQWKPYRDSARAEKKLERANLDALYKKAESENPTSNPISKWRQRQAIKNQYAAARYVQGTASAANTAQTASNAAKQSRKASDFISRHKRGFLLIIGFGLILAFLLNVMSSCSVIIEGIGSAITAGSYIAAEEEMLDAEAAYSAMESDLQNYLDTYESAHDYDEYTYDLDEIKHDPYILMSILHALHPEEWTVATVMPTLEMLFDRQYILTEEVETETRYRTETLIGERHAQDPDTDQYLYDYWGDPIMEEYEYEDEVPYTYYKCTVTLENTDLSHLPVYIMTEEQLSMYALYMSTLGFRPELFPDSEYIDRYINDRYTDYDIPPSALEDEQFAAMITEAEKYLGYPYVWGGSSPSTSFDCSGFVCWVLNHSGWSVGRTSAQGLCNYCTPVSSANVQPGDLVFFKGTYDTPGVSHVGIYVGNNVMIHCGDPISYASLNTTYWRTHFYTYGRLP